MINLLNLQMNATLQRRKYIMDIRNGCDVNVFILIHPISY